MIELRWLDVTDNPPDNCIKMETESGFKYVVLQMRQQTGWAQSESSMSPAWSEWTDIPIEQEEV